MVISYSAMPERVIKAHNETSANFKWIRDNWDTIRQENPDEFIAVVDRKVVFHTKNYAELLKYLAQHRDRPDLVASRTHSANNVLLR